MPISQSDQLFKLVKSLTKAEKRNFRIYSSRIQEADSMKYTQLFDLLDKQSELDEAAILKKIPKSQISNLKRHLYSQILISLKLIHKKKNVHIEIRELLDFAQILYGKGLFLQAMKILDKAKSLSEKNEDDLSYLNVLEFEKIIESRHITRTGPEKTKKKLDLSKRKLDNIRNSVLLSNLKIFLHGLYIKNGHVKSEKERDDIKRIFEENTRNIPLKGLTIVEEVYLYQSFVWYYYILIDFVNCYRYASKWVDLIKSSSDLVKRDPSLLLRGYHYLLTSAFNTLDIENYLKYHDELEQFRKSNYKKFNPNTQIVSFLYAHHGRFNRVFIQGNYHEGLKIIPRTLRRINRYGDRLDQHRIMVFYYKIAWLYMGAGQPNKSLKYLNKIMTMEVGMLRSDIQLYARILHMMAHYDIGNFDIIHYLVNNTIAFSKKAEDIAMVQRTAIDFFKEVVKLPLGERGQFAEKFYKKLETLALNPFERKAFLYLDIMSWTEAKIKKLPLDKVTQNRALRLMS